MTMLREQLYIIQIFAGTQINYITKNDINSIKFTCNLKLKYKFELNIYSAKV